MADKSQRQKRQAKAVIKQKQLWWLPIGIIGGCIAGVVLAYLHLHFGTFNMARTTRAAGANIVILLTSYLIFRRLRFRHPSNSLMGLILSTATALPVFALAFFGLGYEIPEMFDFSAAYIYGAWLGSSEAASIIED